MLGHQLFLLNIPSIFTDLAGNFTRLNVSMQGNAKQLTGAG